MFFIIIIVVICSSFIIISFTFPLCNLNSILLLEYIFVVVLVVVGQTNKFSYSLYRWIEFKHHYQIGLGGVCELILTQICSSCRMGKFNQIVLLYVSYL
jgi:hypothetical protein